ncbi:MAG: GNAT family N-acetyltransferase [Flavobacteriaceae bacterium]|nr:GNAT family N-acetyltransferase [Flavobacteriaceae bacterium]
MELKSNRLLLEEFTKNDASFFYELVNEPDWKQYIGDRQIHTIHDAENYLLNKIIPTYQKLGFGFYIVRLKDSKTPIGMCGLIKRDWMDYVDIGYAFLAQFRGKGYAIEASITVKKHAKTVLGIAQLAAITNVNNERSGNLLKKLGFEYNRLISYPGEESKCKLYLEVI